MDKAVNILSLVPYKFLPPAMGGQKGIAFFNRYLSRLVNPNCVTVKDNTEKASEAYPIKNILSNSPSHYINPFYFFTLRKIIREEKITHLIIEHPYYGWLGILLKWFCNIKLVVHSHNIESLRFKTMNKWWWGILWHYEKLTHRKADHNFFIQDNDRTYAIENFKLDPEKCTTITYGFELSEAPAPADKQMAREQICKLHNIAASDTILLFNGTLGYKPNLDALEVILEKINPILLSDNNFTYKIIICGNKLPAACNGLVDYKERNIIYAGFVDDINLYFKGSDIFINPVIDGGGIKTKVVEALGYDLSVISTQSGAIGIPAEIAESKLIVVQDEYWDEFAKQVISCDTGKRISSIYFNHFYWGNIAAKAAGIFSGIT
ncbi:MAG: glycosyltransferase family 4 protein [Chitinophagaceae bacterium]|nr:glycosyltransferase family 4 protein [Chitinophagaceae bacterium]